MDIVDVSELKKKFMAILKENDFDVIDSYFNGEEGMWCFDKNREIEVIVRINDVPDDETVEEFEEQLKGEQE